MVSRSLSEVGPNAVLLGEGLAAEAQRLKQEETGRINVGGPKLAASLAAWGLIDAYEIYLRPFVVGSGARFFARPPGGLRLVSEDRIGEARGAAGLRIGVRAADAGLAAGLASRNPLCEWGAMAEFGSAVQAWSAGFMHNAAEPLRHVTWETDALIGLMIVGFASIVAWVLGYSLLFRKPTLTSAKVKPAAHTYEDHIRLGSEDDLALHKLTPTLRREDALYRNASAMTLRAVTS